MFNNKKYEISDMAQPAYVYKNGAYVNPAYPSNLTVVDTPNVLLKDWDFMDALKHRLKRARKKQDDRQIRAIQAMLKEINEYEKR